MRAQQARQRRAYKLVVIHEEDRESFRHTNDLNAEAQRSVLRRSVTLFCHIVADCREVAVRAR
jgi:hypothetical protein